jgi:plasmid stabilization system protein ParE
VDERSYALHPEVLLDLYEIWEYIAQDRPDAADRVVDELFAAFDTLARSPHMGHRRLDLASPALRFWPVRSYLIVYAPEEQPLWVIAVLHGRRSPRVLAAVLRSRE